jgi:hypothetical protein
MRKLRRSSLRVIQGSLPTQREWTEAELRRLSQPTIKALPFVKLQKDAQPMWCPESFWHVEQTGNWDRDYVRGREYAIAAMSAIRVDGRNVLPSIFRDMIASGVEREKRKGKRRRGDVVMVGFVHQLGKMFDPRQRPDGE